MGDAREPGKRRRRLHGCAGRFHGCQRHDAFRRMLGTGAGSHSYADTTDGHSHVNAMGRMIAEKCPEIRQ